MASGQTLLRRTPLGLQISQEVRRQILFGHLSPGDPLTQQDLCDRFGTSRMPVRDAINMLVMDGLATRPNNRDAVVADITHEDILDAFEVNAHLHALAAVRAITRGTPEERRRLQSIHEEMDKAVREETCLSARNSTGGSTVNSTACRTPTQSSPPLSG